MKKPRIGEIWIVTIPVIYENEENEISISLQKRPCLILDDGRGLIVEEDHKNYHVFKLTTQDDPYRRKPINNWKALGLRYKSYVRIEMPIKIEEGQFVRKVTELPIEQLKEMYRELYSILNIDALMKMAEEKIPN